MSKTIQQKTEVQSMSSLAQTDETDKQQIKSFYKLTRDMSKKLRESDLTSAEWRLWSYLVTLDPFGDRYIEMPDVLTIMSECGMSKATAYRAIGKFQELGLFDFQATIKYRNLNGEKSVSKMRKDSHPCEKDIKDETDVAAMRKSEAETVDQQRLQVASDIQTSTESTDSVEEDIDTVATTPPPQPGVVAVATWDKDKAVEEVVAIAQSCGYFLTQRQRDQLNELNEEKQFEGVFRGLNELKKHSSVKKAIRFDHALLMGRRFTSS